MCRQMDPGHPEPGAGMVDGEPGEGAKKGESTGKEARGMGTTAMTRYKVFLLATEGVRSNSWNGWGRVMRWTDARVEGDTDSF